MQWKRISFILSLLFASATAISTGRLQTLGANAVGSIIDLDYGTFHGLEDSSTGITYFRGVRYAEPPVGDLRWRGPVSPPTTHLGDVNATQFASSCIETTQDSVRGGTSEDCLFGNIYVPLNARQDEKLPVLVWFHGGGFQGGNTRGAPPELIMHSSQERLIFVSFAYRLGQFGFLGGTQVRSDGALNAGLLDQRAALRWLQRYIESFGGDKQKVTIWGESAGAGSTMYHLIANGGDHENLFRAVMGDSPSLNFAPAFDGDYDIKIYEQFAEFSGCGGTGSETLRCLRSADVNTLASAGKRVLSTRPSTLYVFAPFLDGDFIKKRPVEAFTSGRFAHVPVLFGSNTNEGSGWSSSLPDPSANTGNPNANETTVFNFLRGQYASLTLESVNKAFDLYPLQSYSQSVDRQGQQMYGEARYICTAALITGNAFNYVSAYQFHYDNPHLGSFHGADLQAFFSPPSNSDEKDSALFEAMRQYFTSFVTTGVPTAKNGIPWEPVNNTNGNSRILLNPSGIKMEYSDAALTNRCQFWHGLSQEIQT